LSARVTAGPRTGEFGGKKNPTLFLGVPNCLPIALVVPPEA